MSRNSRDEVVFLLPTSLDSQIGPIAGWLSSAGWVAAANQLGFRSTVVTPYGIADLAVLRQQASVQSGDRNRLSGMRIALPTDLKTAIKDARAWIRAFQFARIVKKVPVSRQGVAFIWQRHELFQGAGAALARRLGRPFVLYVPAPKVWEARGWGVRRLGWAALVELLGDVKPMLKADLVACVSEEVAEMVRCLGIDSKRILVTPSTVDTELFKPGVSGSEVRQRYSLEDRFVVGWTGSFRAFHGLDVLLDAVDKVIRNVPHLKVVLVGDGPERVRLQGEAKRRGLEGFIRFTGTVPQIELPEVLSAFDVAVVTSGAGQSFHYSPLKLWEYLAMARAVIAPSVGSLSRLLESGVNAMLVQPGDCHALANSIVQLANDPTLRTTLGRNGRKLAEASSWAHQFQHVVSRLSSAENVSRKE